MKWHRRRGEAIDAALAAIEITGADMTVISLALQSRVRDMHAAGKHEAAEAAMHTLTKIHALKEAIR